MDRNTQLPSSYVTADRKSSLLKKWGPLLEETKNAPAITDEHTRIMTALVLENQEQDLRKKGMLSESIGSEGVFTGYAQGDPAFDDKEGGCPPPCPGEYGGSVCPTNNDFYARGDARLPKMVLPMIRRTFPSLIANELVGVQPMAGPVGQAFALRMKYDGENLACYTPDGGCTMNAPTSAGFGPYGFRGFGQEAGYNYLNTAHTGTTAAALSGLGVEGTATSGSCFDFTQEDMGVADLLKNTECATNFPQMSLCIEKTSVEAGTRRLAVKFSNEVAEDLQAMHGINLDSEMAALMSYEIQAEIDREIIVRMINIALKGGNYSTWSPCSADGRWSAERAHNLYQHIQVQAQLIATKTRRGCANFLVVTPYVAAILKSMSGFSAYNVDANVTNCTGSETGMARVGTLGGMRVYMDTRTEAQFQAGTRGQRVDYILLGYKGQDYFDTGLIYAPYVPVQIARTMGPNDFSPRIGLRTRYAIVENLFGAENYYHVIVLKGLTDCCESTCKKFMW